VKGKLDVHIHEKTRIHIEYYVIEGLNHRWSYILRKVLHHTCVCPI